jgi:hypothetical protein
MVPIFPAAKVKLFGEIYSQSFLIYDHLTFSKTILKIIEVSCRTWYYLSHFNNNLYEYSIVADLDPGSGAFLTQGSGMG